MSTVRYLGNKRSASKKHEGNGHRITASSLSVKGTEGKSGEVKKHFKASKEDDESPNNSARATPHPSKRGGTRKRGRSRSRSRKYYRR
jgi:hypothetical protein